MGTRESSCSSEEEKSKSATSATTNDTEEVRMQNSHMEHRQGTLTAQTCTRPEETAESTTSETVDQNTCSGSEYEAIEELDTDSHTGELNDTESNTAVQERHDADSQNNTDSLEGFRDSTESCECPKEEDIQCKTCECPKEKHRQCKTCECPKEEDRQRKTCECPQEQDRQRKTCECPQEQDRQRKTCCSVVLDICPDSTEEQALADVKSSDVCYVEIDGDSDSDQEDVCRICHCGHDAEPLISPCLCTGSVKFVHHSCLMNWLQRAVMAKCELCLYPLAVQRKRKPLSKWRLPDEKPIPLIWLMAFVIAMTLNVSSLANDGTQRCTSKPCIVFYVLGSAGALLGMAFFYHWSKKSATYLKKWIAWNEEWRLVGPKDLPATLGHPNLAFSTKSLTGTERTQAQVHEVKVGDNFNACSAELPTISDIETNEVQVA